jgi:hypothetical protein
MAISNITSLVPLAACTGLRKPDLFRCCPRLTSQIGGLQLACATGRPQSVMFEEGMVHQLLPNMPSYHAEPNGLCTRGLGYRDGMKARLLLPWRCWCHGSPGFNVCRSPSASAA